MSLRLPRTEDEVIEYLLGVPPGVRVVVGDTTYVLPRGIDPYWEEFGPLYGYELLPAEEQPIPVGPTRDIWPPGSPRPGFVEGSRKSWTNLPPAVTPENPRLTWQALGDLRRCIRLAVAEKESLLPAKAPEPSDELRPFVCILRDSMKLLDRIMASQKDWPHPRPDHTANIFGGLDAVVVALDQLRLAIVDDQDEAVRRLRQDERWNRMMDVVATYSPPPPYSRSQRGRPPAALLVVHAAHHYFAHCSTEAKAQDLAMIVALEPAADFKRGSGYLHGTGADRRAAKKYWSDRLKDYAMPTKT